MPNQPRPSHFSPKASRAFSAELSCSIYHCSLLYHHFSQLHTAKYVSSFTQSNQTDIGCTQKRVVSFIQPLFLTFSLSGLDMLICYGCGVTVHKYCYGLNTPVDQFLVSEHKISMFVCQKCQYVDPQCPKVKYLDNDNLWESIVEYLRKGS